MRRLTVVLGLVAVLCGLVAGPALAEPPSALSGRVTDSAGVLSTGDVQRVQSAFEQAQQRAGVRLSVAYVTTFDGLSGSAWAEQAGKASGLGADDVLLAVAVKDHQYDVHRGSAVAASRVSSAKGDVQKALADGQWAGAAVALADGVGGAGTSSSGTSSAGGSGLATLLVVLVLVAALGGGYLFFRSRRRRRQLEEDQAAALPAGPRPPADPYAGTPTDQLNGRASSALLDLDEKVRTAQVDLDYARSYYGEDAVPQYGQAMTDAQADLARAFQLRQELDDDIPEDEPTTRRMLAELLQRTGHADQVLTAQAAAVDQLRRARAGRARALDELQRRVDALQQRLPQEQQRMAGLAERYAPSALSAVGDNVDQAGVRLAAAEQALQRARQDAQAGNTGRAVGTLRPAEQALGQSATLLDAVERVEADLTAAEQRLAGARAETEADLAEARSLGAAGTAAACRRRSPAPRRRWPVWTPACGRPVTRSPTRSVPSAVSRRRPAGCARPSVPPGTRPPRPGRPPRRSTRCCSARAPRSGRPVTSSAPGAGPSAARRAPGWPRPSATSTAPPARPPVTRWRRSARRSARTSSPSTPCRSPRTTSRSGPSAAATARATAAGTAAGTAVAGAAATGAVTAAATAAAGWTGPRLGARRPRARRPALRRPRR